MKEGKVCQWLDFFCKKVIWIFAFIGAVTVVLLNFIYTASISYDLTEQGTIEGNSIIKILVMLMGIVLCLALFFMQDWKEVSEKKVFLIASWIYIIAGVFIILNVDGTLRYDQKYVHEATKAFVGGDFTELKKGKYFSHYPFQLGLATYEIFLGLFSQNTHFIFLVNLFEIIGINWFTYKLADLHFKENHTVNLLTILLSFLFLPQFFYLTFAYGLVPGFFCLMAGYYFLNLYLEKNRKRDMVLAAFFLIFSVMLKQNYLIGVLAISIFMLLHTLKKRQIKYLLLALVLLLGVKVSGVANQMVYQIVGETKISEGCPSLLWIAMGTDIDNTENTISGGYNRLNYEVYKESDYNPKEANKKAKKLLKENWEKIKAHPKKAAVFFKDKLVYMWCEPMFQSVWSGPMESAEQEVDKKILRSLSSGGIVEDCVCLFMKAWLLLLFITAFFFIFKKLYKETNLEYAWLFFIGGFLFHIMWEAKSQYIYPYVFILVPSCAYTLFWIAEKVKKKLLQLMEETEGKSEEELTRE